MASGTSNPRSKDDDKRDQHDKGKSGQGGSQGGNQGGANQGGQNKDGGVMQQAKDAVGNVAGGMGGQMMDKAKEAGTQVMDKAREVGGQAMDAASRVGGVAGDTMTNVGKKADDFVATAGADMQKWGDSLDKSGPREGIMGQASHVVADTLKGSGKYLEEAKISGMADDLTSMIKKNPVPAVLIGVGIGFMLGRILRD